MRGREDEGERQSTHLRPRPLAHLLLLDTERVRLEQARPLVVLREQCERRLRLPVQERQVEYLGGGRGW